MSSEQWKALNGYEGLYMISDLGNIKNIQRCAHLTPHRQYSEGKKSFYRHVDLYKNGIRKRFRLHRLVAQTFIPNPLNKKEVNHINGVKSDNRVKNLEWATQMENFLHQLRNNIFSRKTTLTQEQWLILNV